MKIAFASEVFKDDSPQSIMAVLRLDDRDYAKVNLFMSTDDEKIEKCSALFKCSKIETCQLFIKYPFLLRSKTSTLQRKMDLLGKHVLDDEIKKDLWVLTYTVGRLEKRIEKIKSMNIHPIRPWMLRCLPQVLQRTYNNRKENQEALGSHPNAEAYLVDRLGIDEEGITLFAKRHPPALRVQVSKMKEIIDYLLSEGYPTMKIVQTPRILCHSLDTIQERMNGLKKRSYMPKTLSVLCKSKRAFAVFVEKVDSYNAEPKLPQ